MIRTLFSQYEETSWLKERNPSVKLMIVFVYMAAATLLFDIWTLTLLTCVALLATWRLGSVPLFSLMRAMIPFLILGLGYLWMNALFPRGEVEKAEILFRIGPVQVAAQGVRTGLALTTRALCFGATSLFFVTTTDSTAFILSLNQQIGLSPRLAYGVLAAYRFLPLLESDLGQIRAAHRLRGVGAGDGLRGKGIQIYRYTIPLLASAIRRAGRVAVAMESRAFSGDRRRTAYRQLQVRTRDWWLVTGALLVLGLVLSFTWQLGLLRLWHGDLGY